MKPTLNPYLMFKDKSREAMEFYKSVLGGELTMQTFGESGQSMDENEKELIIHAQLTTSDGLIIMASDGGEMRKPSPGNSVSLSIIGEDEEKLKKWFNELSQGGNIDMPLEKQFWGDTFGAFTDKFGIPWMVNISQSTNA